MHQHFCTCSSKECPHHPLYQASSCDACIQKNLRLGEIPACFWTNAKRVVGTTEYSALKFAKYVLKNQLYHELAKHLPEYTIQHITNDNYECFFDIHKSNDAFFQLTEGRPASLKDFESDLANVPDGFHMDDMDYVGIKLKEQHIAVFSYLKGFPDKDIVWLGLLLVHGDYHGAGYGSTILNAFEQSAIICGYKKVQLGVVSSNQPAIAYWEKQGYQVNRVTEDHKIIVYGKELSVMKSI